MSRRRARGPLRSRNHNAIARGRGPESRNREGAAGLEVRPGGAMGEWSMSETSGDTDSGQGGGERPRRTSADVARRGPNAVLAEEVPAP